MHIESVAAFADIVAGIRQVGPPAEWREPAPGDWPSPSRAGRSSVGNPVRHSRFAVRLVAGAERSEAPDGSGSTGLRRLSPGHPKNTAGNRKATRNPGMSCRVLARRGRMPVTQHHCLSTRRTAVLVSLILPIFVSSGGLVLRQLPIVDGAPAPQEGLGQAGGKGRRGHGRDSELQTSPSAVTCSPAPTPRPR